MLLSPVLTSIVCLTASVEAHQPAELSLTEGQTNPVQQEAPAWEGSITLGSSISAGNSEVVTISSGATVARTKESGKWDLGLSSVYVKDADTVTKRRNEGKAKYDHNLSERVYVYGSLGAMNDAEADLDLRTDTSTGGGYKVWSEGPWTLDTELGLAYLSEEFSTGQENEYLALRSAYGLKWDSEDERTHFEQSGSLSPSLDGGGDGYYRLDTSLKLNLSSNMFTKLQWVYDHTVNPAVGKGNDDHLFLVTVGWSF